MIFNRFTLVLSVLFWLIQTISFGQAKVDITPNDFQGSDTERIQQAVRAARGTTNLVKIPRSNANGTTVWKIDEAILLPSDLTLILDNCTIQLSDSCRDNMFRSDNAGLGVENPEWNKNIHIIGQGNVVLKGADNPRATGDGARKLTLDPLEERKKGNWRVSYGSDAAHPDRKQTGDWRNIMILIVKVNGFTLKNVRIENSHAWAVSFERTINADLSDIELYNPEHLTINGKEIHVFNKDGIDLRQGCKNFRIHNIRGFTADDFIALSNLDTNPDPNKKGGTLNSTMLTVSRWMGPEDDIEQIYITNINCESICRAVAIRASDSASVHHVYIDGLMSREVKGQGGRHNAVLIGGKGYGQLSHSGKINHIFVTNVISDGHSSIRLEAPVADCHFMNILYHGHQENVIEYAMERSVMKNLSEINLNKVNSQ